MATTPDIRPVGDLPDEIGKTAARGLRKPSAIAAPRAEGPRSGPDRGDGIDRLAGPTSGHVVSDRGVESPVRQGRDVGGLRSGLIGRTRKEDHEHGDDPRGRARGAGISRQ